jgi:hypothetical protein
VRLSELLAELQAIGIGKVGTWQINGREGITLGDPLRYFPYATGPQYPVDCTADTNPFIVEEEVAAIRRRFFPPQQLKASH